MDPSSGHHILKSLQTFQKFLSVLFQFNLFNIILERNIRVYKSNTEKLRLENLALSLDINANYNNPSSLKTYFYYVTSDQERPFRFQWSSISIKILEYIFRYLLFDFFSIAEELI